MDGELAYWQAKAGSGPTEALENARHSYLKAQNGGVTDSVESLFVALYGPDGELAYWRTVSGLPTAAFADAKYAAINGFVATAHISIYRSEVNITG